MHTGEMRSGGLNVCSKIADDVWHADKEAGAYEWWYFDAVSDDGRDVLVIIFLYGFVFSPRYNRAVARHLTNRANAHQPDPINFPAVAVWLYRDGRPLVRAVNEYEASDFEAQQDSPACRIGENSFHLQTKADSTRYLLALNTPLRGRRHFKASFEWQVCEADFLKECGSSHQTHVWNMVAPRCRVRGTFSVSNARGECALEQQFNGTGYHDHNRDRRWLPATVSHWQWGRAHFDDLTIVFYHYRERYQTNATTRLFIVQENFLKSYKAQLIEREMRRDIFGLRYPRDLEIGAARKESMLTLRLKQHRLIDRSFFYLRFIGEAVLQTRDGQVRRAMALSEHLAPRALQWKSLWWLTRMRIGSKTCGSFLP